MQYLQGKKKKRKTNINPKKQTTLLQKIKEYVIIILTVKYENYKKYYKKGWARKCQNMITIS